LSSVFGKSLKRDQDLLFKLLFEVLKNPSFEASKIEVLRQKVLQAISRRNETPMSVARREFLQRLFGTQNIWARAAEESTIKSITREDLIQYHQTYFGPSNFWFAVTGDIEFEEAKNKIEDFLKTANQQAQKTPAVSPLNKDWKSATYLIDQQFKQSAVVMGHVGDKRFNPDKYALNVANYIVGGATFGSRLGNKIRTSLGLAYGISSSFGMGTDFGAFQIMASTQTTNTVRMVQEIKKILQEILKDNAVLSSELATAKQAILNQLIFENEDLFEMVKTRRFYDYYGYPADYLNVYQKEISKVELADVQRVLKKYFYPDKLIILIVGDKKGMGDLSGLGSVIEQAIDND
jgi:zinc protease